MLSEREVVATLEMLRSENLDVRTVTLGVSLFDCASEDPGRFVERVRAKLTRLAGNLVEVCDEVGLGYGIPIVNKRISVSPIAVAAGSFSAEQMGTVPAGLDDIARQLRCDFLGGFSALVEKGFSRGDRALIEVVPAALARTARVCSSINVASTAAGINMDAVALMGSTIRRAADKMFGRPTGNARHLTDPANLLYCASMEEGLYEIDVHTLAVTELWRDEQLSGGRHAGLPGYHGKGLYSGQGVVVYANNGGHATEARTNPAVPSGVLAEWNGTADAWNVVRRNQFTEISGPGGIYGNANSATDPLWTIGWDHRSLILMVRQDGRWHSFRLPKSSHSYDGAHGWNTEWPRIRDIGEDDLMSVPSQQAIVISLTPPQNAFDGQLRTKR